MCVFSVAAAHCSPSNGMMMMIIIITIERKMTGKRFCLRLCAACVLSSKCTFFVSIVVESLANTVLVPLKTCQLVVKFLPPVSDPPEPIPCGLEAAI